MKMRDTVLIDDLNVSAYTIPTESPEADGTYEWDSTTIVIVDVTGGGKHGLGYTYADTATAKLVADKLKQSLIVTNASLCKVGGLGLFISIPTFAEPGIGRLRISLAAPAFWIL